MFKKIILLSVCVLSVLAVSVYATIRTPVVTALNSTTYTAIVIPENGGKCRPITAWTETGVGFYIAVDSSGTGEALIPAPGTYSNSCVTYKDGLLFYAKAISGTPNLAVNFGVNP